MSTGKSFKKLKEIVEYHKETYDKTESYKTGRIFVGLRQTIDNKPCLELTIKNPEVNDFLPREVLNKFNIRVFGVKKIKSNNVTRIRYTLKPQKTQSNE